MGVVRIKHTGGAYEQRTKTYGTTFVVLGTWRLWFYLAVRLEDSGLIRLSRLKDLGSTWFSSLEDSSSNIMALSSASNIVNDGRNNKMALMSRNGIGIILPGKIIVLKRKRISYRESRYFSLLGTAYPLKYELLSTPTAKLYVTIRIIVFLLLYFRILLPRGAFEGWKYRFLQGVSKFFS